MEKNRKRMVGGVIAINFIILCSIFSWWFYTSHIADYRFTSNEGYDFALKEVKEWNEDAFLIEIISKDARKLDGRNDIWTYGFYSQSTIINNTDNNQYDHPWRVDRLTIEISKDHKGYHSQSQLDYWTYSTPNITKERFGVNINLSSVDVAGFAEKTDDVRNLRNESNSMWIDYRLSRNYWTLDISTVEHSPHLNNGMLVVVTVYPDTGKVLSYTEDMDIVD